MTSYRLPDDLGGYPCTLIRRNVPTNDMWEFVVDRGHDSFPICLPPTVVVEVEPPLPAEPPRDAVMVDRNGRVWLCGSHGWFAARHHGETVFTPWAELCGAEGPLTQLVPDPVASAPELPFRETYGEVQANTPGYDDHQPVRIALSKGFYHPDDAEQIGLAILRAAREARAAS